MIKKSTIINTDEIRDVFQENCEQENLKFSGKKFQKFLEIDFYDWVKENLNQFYQQKLSA